MTAGLIVQPMGQWLMRSREFTGAVDGISSTFPGSFNDLPIVPVSNTDDPATYANAFEGDWPGEGNQDGLTTRNDFAQGISFADPFYTYFQTANNGGVIWKSDRWMHNGPFLLTRRPGNEYGLGQIYPPRMILVFPEHNVVVSSLEQTSSSPFDTGTYYMAAFDADTGEHIQTLAALRYDVPLGTSRRRVISWCSNRVDGIVYSVENEQTFREIDFIPTVVGEKYYVMATSVSGGRTTLAQYNTLPYPSIQRVPYGITYDYIGERILLCMRAWPNRDALTSTASPATDSIEAMDKQAGTTTPLVTWTPPVEETFAGSGVYLHSDVPAVAWTHGLERVMYLWRAPAPSLPVGVNDNLRAFWLDGSNERVVVERDWHASMFGRAALSSSTTGRHDYCFGPGMRAQWEL